MAQQDNSFDMLYAPPPSSQDGTKKFSDELLRLKGKVVELYIGDQYECLNFDDYSQQQNATIFGRLVDIFDRFVVLDCFYVDKTTNELKKGNIIYINSFQIRVMTEVNDNGSLDDVFLSAKDVSKIRKLMSEKKI